MVKVREDRQCVKDLKVGTLFRPIGGSDIYISARKDGRVAAILLSTMDIHSEVDDLVVVPLQTGEKVTLVQE